MAFDFTTSTEEAETGASLEIPVSMAGSKPVRATQRDPVLKTKLGKKKKKVDSAMRTPDDFQLTGL